MTRDTALLRLQYRTEQLMRMAVLGAPGVIIAEQQRMVAEAREWVDSPPPEIPD